jgi:hypothetical protein
MVQISRFENGGFVVHKIPCPSSGNRCSAWFDAEGKILDAERIDTRGRSMPVKRGGPLWDTCRMWGGVARHARPGDSRVQVA